MEYSKDPGKPMAIMALIIALLGIFLTIISEINLDKLILLIALTISAIVITYLSFYIQTTNKNSEDIEEIKKNFKFEERLDKLEIKVFKK